MINAISTGEVKITRNWLSGKGDGAARLVNTLIDTQFTDWLPIWTFIIEHPLGLIVVDTGIPEQANDPVYFPPQMRLVQRAAKFRIPTGGEIGPQMQQLGYDQHDVRYVVLTHLHQDHDGGLHHFPKAEFIVSRTEWEAANGLAGRMSGYLNQRWPKWFSPKLVDFQDGPFELFPSSQSLGDGLTLVPTPGHSSGHMSLIMDQADTRYMFIGDAAYSEKAMYSETLDGITTDVTSARQSMQRLRAAIHFGSSIVLPSHDPGVSQRLK